MGLVFWQLSIFALIAIIGVLCFALYRTVHNARQTLKAEIEQRQNLEEYISNNPNPLIKIDKRGICYFSNQAAEPILLSWQIKLNDKIPPEWFEVITQILASEETQTIEIPCQDKTYLSTIVPIKGNRALLFGTDVTHLKQFEKELTANEVIDEETQLPNQVVFKSCLEAVTATFKDEKSNLGVIIIRFEDYDQITLTYGRDITTKILIELSQRIKSKTHEDIIITRISTNEFGVIDPNMSQAEQTFYDIQSLIKACTSVYNIDEREIYISISIGITFCPMDSAAPDTLARNAQLALNRAKLSNHNFAFFKRDMEEQLQQRREIIKDLHRAIHDNQFFLVYQPQVSLHDLTLIGCEALIRWQHPTKGLISPFHFIPAAEDANLINDIGNWVLEESCRQIVKWREAQHAPIKVAVNLAASQVLEGNIISLIKEMILKYEVNPDWLSFELTESALVEDKTATANILKQIKEMGFEISIDDFGTGYSSLSYLVQFPIDKIKIDRSFVIEIKNEQEGHAVTKTIVKLGHDMNLKVVAEGVENYQQTSYLKQCGCDIIQGYYFGKPERADAFETFFNQTFKIEANKKLKGNIKVGILHSLTGTMAISEKPVADATLLAIEEINKKGGLLGRKIEPIFADGQSTPEVFAKQAEHLITHDGVSAIFGIWNSHSRKAVKEVIEKHQHLLIYPTAFEGLEESSHILYTGGTANQLIMPGIKWAIDNIGKRFYIVASDYIGPASNNAIIQDQIMALGGEVLSERLVILGELDLEEVVKDIKLANPDVIINNINGEANIHFFNELRKQGITSDKIKTISFNINEVGLQSIRPEMIAGDYAVWNYFQNITSERNQRFIRKYQARFGANRATGDTVEAGYFGVYLWAQAVKDAQSDNVLDVIKKLPGQKFNAPGGKVMIDEEINYTWKVARIAKIDTKGEPVIVWSSGSPIKPIPYPSYKTKEEWNAFLQDLFKQYGNRWYRVKS